MCRLRHKYQAGTYVELNDGFNSGTDFVAEINPCVSIVTVIAAKTNDDEVTPYNEPTEIQDDVRLKIYPTILPSGNAVNIIASQTLDNVITTVYDLSGKPVASNKNLELQANSAKEFLLPALASGFYLVRVENSNISFIQKIIIQWES